MNAEQFFNNGFGDDIEKVHRNHVIKLMTNFAKHYHTEQLVSFLRQYQKSCEIMHINKIEAKKFVKYYKLNLKQKSNK